MPNPTRNSTSPARPMGSAFAPSEPSEIGCKPYSGTHKKAGLWPAFLRCFDLLLISLGSLDDGGAGGVGAFPAFNLDPLALFQILVVLEEVLDLLDQQRGQVGVFLDVVVQLSQLLVRDGDQLGVATGFIGPVQHA